MTLQCSCGSATWLSSCSSFDSPSWKESTSVVLQPATLSRLERTFFGVALRRQRHESLLAIGSRAIAGKIDSRFPSLAGANREIVAAESASSHSPVRWPSRHFFHETCSHVYSVAKSGRVPLVVCHATGPPPAPPRVEQRIIRSDAAKKPQKKGKSNHNMMKRPPPPQLSEEELSNRLLPNQEVMLKYPLLGSMLPVKPLNDKDNEWMAANLDSVKAVLGYPLPEMAAAPEGHPVTYLDTLLYCSLVSRDNPLVAGGSRVAGLAHGRLAILGEHIAELAMAEFLVQRYPREVPASLRERSTGMMEKRVLPSVVEKAGLAEFVFPPEESEPMPYKLRQPIFKSVFYAILAVGYLMLGPREVYRLLFDVFHLDPDSPECAPMPRPYIIDEDRVHADLEAEGKPPLTWHDVADYLPPPASHLAHPRLFNAVVPPGMVRFRGSDWERISLPFITQAIGYPLRRAGTSLAMTRAQRDDVTLAIQLAYMHTSLHKQEHPRFSYERLEYIGQRIQDVVMIERLLTKYFDAPGPTFLFRKHRALLRNRVCGRYLRELALHTYIQFGEDSIPVFERNRVARVLAQAAVHQALHGAAYLVYGKSEVRRLMFDVWKLDGGWLT